MQKARILQSKDKHCLGMCPSYILFKSRYARRSCIVDKYSKTCNIIVLEDVLLKQYLLQILLTYSVGYDTLYIRFSLGQKSLYVSIQLQARI